MATIFDQDPEGMAPPGAPKVWVIPASFGMTPDPARAILDASPQVELFDEEVWDVPKTWVDPLVTPPALSPAALTAQLAALPPGEMPIVLGADERCLAPLVAHVPGASILYLAARPRLAAGSVGDVVGDVVADGRRVVAGALRDLTAADAAAMATAPASYTPFMARDRTEATPAQMAMELGAGPVVIGLDVAALDGAIMPATPAPAPGGLSWGEIMDILRATTADRPLLGVALFGLAPQSGNHAADFLVAKLAYKILTYGRLKKAA